MERSYASIEGPDVLRWVLVGTVSVDDVQRLFAEELEFCRDKRFIYVLVDMRRMVHIDSAARRAAGRSPLLNGKPLPVDGIAIVGGSQSLRLLGKMINKAAALLKNKPEASLEFFDEYERAMSWFDARRSMKK
ncbi:MAG TPA: STAS/SEC14 domain-containing protein [Polyangium sp.]|nr:STAS/SEC14 domain-containing protein [Polyangium sp.]